MGFTVSAAGRAVGIRTWASLTLCAIAWVVAIAGLAASQANCADSAASAADFVTGIEKFSSNATCGRVYRYYWYIITYQVVLILLAAFMLLTGAAKAAAASLTGLFSVGMVLCITFTDAFLAASDVSQDAGRAQLATRQRVVTAGALMMALFDSCLILCFGTPWADVPLEEVRAEVI